MHSSRRISSGDAARHGKTYADAGFVHASDCLRAGACDWADAVSIVMPNAPTMIAPDMK